MPLEPTPDEQLEDSMAGKICGEFPCPVMDSLISCPMCGLSICPEHAKVHNHAGFVLSRDVVDYGRKRGRPRKNIANLWE